MYIDFVVLLAIGMDANRNYDHYVEGNSPKIDEALGNTEWRERWKAVARKKEQFQAVSGGGVLQKHGVAQVSADAAGPHEAGQIG